jgi:hypothetical protein
MTITTLTKRTFDRLCVSVRLLIVLVLVSAPQILLAFEIDSEYRTIPTDRGFQEIRDSVSPSQIDSEYQSDLLTYTDSPFSISYESAAVFFETSAGSLSATQFDFRLRAKFIKPLSENLRFVFLRTEHENYEEQSSTSIVELQYRLNEPFWISTFGTLDRMKREDDVGFALTWRDQELGQAREARFYITFPDFTRSERNDASDRFQSNPSVIGLKLIRSRPDLFRLIEFRRESPVSWRDATEGLYYEMTFFSYKRVTPSWALRAQFDRKQAAKQSFDISGAVTSEDGMTRHREQLEWRQRMKRLEAGIAWVGRRWEDGQSRKLIHENLMFFFDWRPSAVSEAEIKNLGEAISGPEIGLETTRFAKHGDASLGSPTTRDLAWESRLNSRYRWVFEKDGERIGELSLALTFDVDRTEGGFFEGGHGQFQISF